jgi:hypothetical protein
MKRFSLLRVTAIISSIAGAAMILFGGIKTPGNFRILSDFIQNLLLINAVLLLFLPSDREMKVALLIGLFTMGFDFFLEEIAVFLEWWYPLGGTQFPPIIVVPMEMVASFFIIGTSMGVILYFPEKIREINYTRINWLKTLFKSPRYDTFWRVVLLFINAIIGTNGDYTAGPNIWVPGPTWHPLFTFIVWFGGGLFTLIIWNILNEKLKNQEG